MAVGFDPTQLTDCDRQLATAWRAAAADLGVRVVAPFDLPVEPAVFRYGALVAGFGTAKGVLLRADVRPFHPDSCGAIWHEAVAAGYTAANVSPSLCRFDRDEFTLFLNFFEWCGSPGERPPWHTGPAEPGQQMGRPEELA